jgi:hypothetical protein
MYINIIHHKKKSPKNFIHNLSFEVYMQFSNFLKGIILSQIYSIHLGFSLFVGFKELID